MAGKKIIWTAVLAAMLVTAGPALAVGGEDCASATVVGGLPYTDTGNTCAFVNTYTESCPTQDTAPDVVYRYLPAVSGCIDILLCNTGSGTDLKLYVYASDAGGCPPPFTGESTLEIACNDAGCPPYAQIPGLAVNAAVDYWIVVDGSGDACGNYRLDIIPCGGCQGPQDCADGNPCTLDVCNGGVCQNPPRPQGAPCGSAANTDCDHPDACDGAGTCQPNLEPNGTACADGLFCTEGETCTDGVCGNGNPRDCDDGLACTDDSCSEFDRACVHIPIDNCCVTDPDCNDGNVCTDDICNNGICQHANNAAPCDDEQFCTVGDVCANGACLGGSPRSCDDGDPCTLDTCDEIDDGCVHTGIDNCCVADADCDDGNECTDDVCDTGTCQHLPTPAGTPCGNPGANDCTAPDTCDGAGACASNHRNEGGPCDDLDLCTMNDICQNGRCIGIPDPACGVCLQDGDPADPTNQLSFQALLKEASGQPVQGPVNLVFQFYDLVGMPVGSPIPVNGVTVTDGILTTTIPITETVFDGTGRELGVSVNGTPELAPRVRVSSAPQAFRVKCVSGDDVQPRIILGSATASGSLQMLAPTPDGTRAAASTYIDLGAVDCGGSFSLSTLAQYVGETEKTTVELKACDGPGAYLSLRTGSGAETMYLNAGTGGAKTKWRLYTGETTVDVDADDGNAAEVTLGNATTTTIELDADDDLGGGGAVLWLSNDAGQHTIEIDGEESDDGVIRLFDASGNTSIRLHADQSNDAPEFSMYDVNGTDLVETVEIRAAETSTARGAQIALRDFNGNTTIEIDASYNGKGRINTEELAITGGSDLSEHFDVTTADGEVRPGLLVSIDADRPGKLIISHRAYDRRVAGVLSGAGGISPGMLMGQSGSVADGQHPVALSGRVYCWADASIAPIGPGDLLTTSDVPGHAMKVAEYDRAQGAIVGKAMTGLNEGRGLVLVLVNLH